MQISPSDIAQAHQIIEISIKEVEIFSIISSVLSLVLGVVAIVLSILFYKMSVNSAKDADASSRETEANVKKLEVVFDKLYSGTFDMMKETVSDMRKHVYKNVDSIQMKESISEEINEKTNDIVVDMIKEIKSNQKSDAELEQIVLNLIEKSKEVEKTVKFRNIRGFIVEKLRNIKDCSFSILRDEGKGLGFSVTDIMDELIVLIEEGIIVDPFHISENGEEVIMSNSPIRLSRLKHR